MWTILLSFLKEKVFSETGVLIIPLIALLAIFAIWNSDSILTKFGFETTANLKAEVTRLKAKVDQLEEANKKLKTDLKRTEEKCTINADAVSTICVVKEETKATVDTVIGKRKQESDRIKQEMYQRVDNTLPTQPSSLLMMKSVKEPVPVKEVSSTYKSTPTPAKEKTTPTLSKVDRLSLNNIQTINEAYDKLFKED